MLLLFHGNGDSAACWPDAVARWSPRFHVVGVDMRGHGGSPRFTPEQLREPGDVFVADTAAVLGGLRRPGMRVVAIGHSLGAAALTAACSADASLADALVLIDPPWDMPVITGMRPEIGAERRRLVVAYATEPEAELEALREREPRWPETERRAWIAAKADVDLDYIATGGGRPSTPWTEHVPHLGVPTLVVTGDDEVLVGPATMTALATMGNPLVELAVVRGAGHYVRQDSPDAFHAVVDPWLEQMTRGRGA